MRSLKHPIIIAVEAYEYNSNFRIDPRQRSDSSPLAESLKFCHKRLVFLNPRRAAALCGDNERSEAEPLLKNHPTAKIIRRGHHE